MLSGNLTIQNFVMHSLGLIFESRSTRGAQVQIIGQEVEAEAEVTVMGVVIAEVVAIAVAEVAATASPLGEKIHAVLILNLL